MDIGDGLQVYLKNTQDDEQKYDFSTIKSELAYKYAAQHNLDVILPQPNELFLDLDSAAHWAAYAFNLPKFALHIAGQLNEKVTASKSGDENRRHVVLTLDKDVTPLERIMFQLMLGSDSKRELLSYIRFINDDPNPTLFYEKRQLLLQGENDANSNAGSSS